MPWETRRLNLHNFAGPWALNLTLHLPAGRPAAAGGSWSLSQEPLILEKAQKA